MSATYWDESRERHSPGPEQPQNTGSTGLKENQLLQAALWYANIGLPVFPCKPRGKEPLTPHGFKDATTDPNHIKGWWTRWPDANIGMPTGGASGLVAVDIDPRNDGDASWAALQAGRGISRTAIQKTGGGGRHILFRDPGGVLCGSLAQGIDLKGEGGYIILSPSIHPNGQPYRWTDGRVALFKVANVPTWLLSYLRRARHKSRTVTAGNNPGWAEGERNNHLTSLAGTMRRRGMSRESIEAALLQENRLRCNPPLDDDEVRRIAESISRYEPGDDTLGRSLAEREATPHSNWPDRLEPEALHGLVGDLVRLIEPHSEADPAALLVQFIAAFGNLVGRRAHFTAEADRHFTNLFVLIVGRTSKSRKGASLGQINRILSAVDRTWSDTRILGGLSSGEGLIWAVRDEILGRSPVRKNGRIARHENVVTDVGVTDKRLLVVEPEFARVLQVTEREANTLSSVIRQAWDLGSLRIMTKNQAASATGAHVSIIGHITKDELRRLLRDTAAANGFANRFLWVCARRSKCLPEGGALDTEDLEPLIERVRAAAEFARGIQQTMCRSEKARILWANVYRELSEGKPGLLGAVTSRAEAQVMRIACLYALLDQSPVIEIQHLKAALAVWRYCESSARFIFGSALGDKTADEIFRALRQRPDGMTRDEIRQHFSRNLSSAEIGSALSVLQEHGLARVETDRVAGSDGRPPEWWLAV